MSANHVPVDGCPRCMRRSLRLERYEQRMGFRASPAGQQALAKADLLRIKREIDYQNETPDRASHNHRRGRRERIASNRRRQRERDG